MIDVRRAEQVTPRSEVGIASSPDSDRCWNPLPISENDLRQQQGVASGIRQFFSFPFEHPTQGLTVLRPPWNLHLVPMEVMYAILYVPQGGLCIPVVFRLQGFRLFRV